ncbi:MAG: type IX secretion system membrane protein PorP/SprF [Flavobacteriales bacterium]
MKKLILIGLFSCGISTIKAQNSMMFDNLFIEGLSNFALSSIDTAPQVQFLYSNVDLLGGAQNHSVATGQFSYKSMVYGVQAGIQNYQGIDHTVAQVNVGRSYQINAHSGLSFSVNGGFYQRQFEAPNAQTEFDQAIREQMDYTNVYGGFSVGYAYKDLNVGLSSGDLFNTSLDKSASWNLQADYTVDVLDSVIVLKPMLNVNQGYDLDGPIAMIGLNTVLNKYVTTTMGYYTNESIHLGMGILVDKLSINYRFRYYHSAFREIKGGQNIIQLNYRF